MNLFRSSLLFSVLLSTISGFSQLEPVKWDVSATEGENGQYTLVFKASIDEGWKVYSQDHDTTALIKPIPLALYFEAESDVVLVGSTEELGKAKAVKEFFFDCITVKSYEKRVLLRQTIESTASQVIGFFSYQTCDDAQCLPPTDVYFRFSGGSIEVIEVDDELFDKAYTQTSYDPVDAKPKEGGPCDEEVVVTGPEEPTGAPIEEEESKGLWGLFILGLGGGLFALLTPCVFPMIPLTVSFFTKRSTDRRKGFANALLYAGSIIFIFLALGFVITYAFGPEKLNAMASNKWFNLAFFVVFIVFAISFFGAFELSLPSSWTTRTDAIADRGGLIGVFFMAFTLVLVSFSCTIPIVGTVLILIADSGQFWGPLLGMLGFSMALAIPFALFAAFPAWLNTLPKSGGWLNRIKVTLGFVELALAFKFLSVADLAYHWNFLTRDIFLAIWIIAATLLGFYLLGKIKLSGDSDSPHVGIPRLFFAILSFAFAVYMIPGLWGAPVNLLSGIAPPAHYQEFSLNHLDKKFMKLESQFDRLATRVAGEELNDPRIAELKNRKVITEVAAMHCPNELDCWFDYGKSLEAGAILDKPVLVDFTGWSCVNCRKMEDNVWSKDRVWKILNDEYVVVSLYVDDKTRLPEEARISPYTGNKVRRVGELWMDLTKTHYNQIAQPWYVLLDPANPDRPLQPPRGYTPNIEEYAQFLEAGVAEFEKRNGKSTAALPR